MQRMYTYLRCLDGRGAAYRMLKVGSVEKGCVCVCVCVCALCRTIGKLAFPQPKTTYTQKYTLAHTHKNTY